MTAASTGESVRLEGSALFLVPAPTLGAKICNPVLGRISLHHEKRRGGYRKKRENRIGITTFTK